MSRIFVPTRFLTLAAVAVPGLLSAADWPRWRGPDGNGISREAIAENGWPDGDLELLWKGSVGTGFSSAAVADGRLFISGNEADTDTLYCLDARTGKALWKHSWPAEVWPYLYEGGPNATATVDGDSVFALGRHGPLFRFEAATGRIAWKVDLHEELGLKKPSWGFTSAPLVRGGRVYLNAGTHGLALDRETGKVVWETGKDDSAYATPEPVLLGGTEALLVFGPASLAAVRADSGKLLWETPWKTNYKVNAAQPIVDGSRIFLSSAYDFGCALLECDAEGVREVWRSKAMQNHFNSSVLLDGHLYGVSGTDAAKCVLVAMEYATGKVCWEEKGVGLGSVTAARDWLIVLTDRGELQFAKASPEGFDPVYRSQVLGGKCWTPPVLANGVLYCRNAAGEVAAVRAP